MTAKLLIFPHTCLFAFLRDHNIYFLAHAQLIISEKSVSQYTSYSLILSPLHSIINREQHEKHLYNKSSHYEKMEWSIIKVRTSDIDVKVDVWCITTLCFTFNSLNFLLIFVPASTEAITCIPPNHHLCGSGKRYGVQRRAKVSFGRTMMQAVVGKRHTSGHSNVKQSLSSYRVMLV